MAKNSPFQFNIQRILDCGFTIEEGVNLKKEGEAKIGYGMNFSFDVSKGWMQYLLKAEFKTVESQQTFITQTVLTKFGVYNLIDFIEENNKVSFPNAPLANLFEISFSHLRAILAKNVAGTTFSDFYLPPQAPIEILTDLLNESIQRQQKLLENDATLVRSQGL